jgi:hypothetical protein
MQRAREPFETLYSLPDPAWVRCPRCDRPAQIIRLPYRFIIRAGAKLRCGHCGFAPADRAAFAQTHSRHAVITRRAPRCDRCGRPAPRHVGGTPRRHGAALTVDWRCSGCHHVSRFPARGAMPPPRDGHDHWFGLPLVLVEPVGAHLVWAYNVRHIAMLEAWLGATLRERSRPAYHATMMARLPRWMKAASARPRIVTSLARLRARAEREGLS